MIKINDEIIATAEQNIVITQENYNKLTNAEKNNPLKTYFISDSSTAAQNTVANEPAAQLMRLNNDDFAADADDSDCAIINGNGTEYVVADENGNIVGPMEDQNVGSTDFVDTDLIGLSIADAIGNASMLASYGGDGTIVGAIADLYNRLGVEPDTSEVDEYDAPLTYNDYLYLIGDRSILDQFDMPNITAALMDLFDRVADAENKAEIARVNAEDAMKAQAEAEAAQAAAEKARKEAEEAKAETEKDLANATNRAGNAEASASDAWKQLHDTTEELNAEKTKNELLQSELDAAKKSEENNTETTDPDESTGTETTTPSESTDTTGSGETTDTDKGDTTPPESTDETTPGSSEDKSTSESESADTVTGEPDASTETGKTGESTEASGTTDEATESPEETTTENKSEETVETPSTESTEDTGVKEDTSSETPATEDSVPASSDEEK